MFNRWVATVLKRRLKISNETIYNNEQHHPLLIISYLTIELSRDTNKKCFEKQ